MLRLKKYILPYFGFIGFTMFVKLMGAVLDAPMADALYTAISTDTGCFRFSNTTAHTFQAAAACAAAAHPS